MTAATLAAIAERIKAFEQQGASFALCADGSLNFSRGTADMAEINAFVQEHIVALKMLVGSDAYTLKHYQFGEYLRGQMMSEEFTDYEPPRVRPLLDRRRELMTQMDTLNEQRDSIQHEIASVDQRIDEEREAAK